MTDGHSHFRFANVLVKGGRARSEHANVRRLTTMLDAAWQITEARWHLLETVFFPSGFFHHGKFIGENGFGGYRKEIEGTMFHDFVMEALEILRDNSPFAFIVAGIDTTSESLCVVWDRKGVAGVGRGRYRQAPQFKPVAALPVSNNTGEAIVIRLFEARL